MRTILFHIPSELFGIPMLGFGWLLGLWVVVSLFFAWTAFRAKGNEEDGDSVSLGATLVSLAMYLGLGVAVIGFVLPNLENQVAGENLGLPVRGYGVAMFLAVSAGVALAVYRGMRRGLDSERIISLAVWMFVAGILGARLFYLYQYGHEIQADSWVERMGKFANIAGGGLVVYGSLIGALLAYTVFVLRHRLPPLVIADLLAPSMLLGLAIGRIGCLMNGCCYGSPCDYAWAVQFPQGSPPYEDQLEHGLQHGIYWSPLAGSDGEDSQEVTSADKERATTATEFSIGFVDPDGPAAAAGVQPQMRIGFADWKRLAYAQPYDAVTMTDRASGTAAAPSLPLTWKAGLVPKRSLPTHPTQIYSATNAILLCGFVLAIAPFVRRDGALLAITLMVYPVTRFLLEIVRIDEPSLNQFGWTISQTVSVGILAVGLALALFVWRQPVGKQHAQICSPVADS